MTDEQLEKLVLDALEDFYSRRLARIESLKLKGLLERKNPYLFRALGFSKASELIERLLESYIWSSDEGIFGDAYFEPIAKAVSGGVVSPSEGIDIAIETSSKYTAISVKSGPNIFNASQKKKQNAEFMSLRSRVAKIGKQFDALLAAGYGKKTSEPSGSCIFRVRSGQAFWTEITGDPLFYLRLHRIMGEHPLNHRPSHQKAWAAVVNKFTMEFVRDFANEKGEIDWDKVVEFNSGEKKKSKSKKDQKV